MYDNDENLDPRMVRLFLICGIGAVILSLIIFGSTLAGTYNTMVDMKEDVALAEANVQTMMQRRLELIPDLVETVKQYTEHEEKILSDITSAREALVSCLNSNSSPDEISKANEELSRQINQLVTVIHENYPVLASGEQYTSLMDQLEGSVNRIAVARETYNTKVSKYNRAIKKFPYVFLARIFGFDEIEPFAADEEASKTNLVNWEN